VYRVLEDVPGSVRNRRVEASFDARTNDSDGETVGICVEVDGKHVSLRFVCFVRLPAALFPPPAPSAPRTLDSVLAASIRRENPLIGSFSLRLRQRSAERPGQSGVVIIEPVSWKGARKLVGRDGIEPPTPGFSDLSLGIVNDAEVLVL
jgi:hypothetical protein